MENNNKTKYVINYGQYCYNDWEEYDSLAEAMHAADDGAEYTQEDIKIYTVSSLDNFGADAVPVAMRRWWSMSWEFELDYAWDDRDDIIEIGDGYYGAWRVRLDAWEDPEDIEAEYECRCSWEYCGHDEY